MNQAILFVFIVLLSLSSLLLAREVVELEATNLELTLTAYQYLAILFYDDSPQSDELMQLWEETAKLLPEEFAGNSEIAKVDFLQIHRSNCFLIWILLYRSMQRILNWRRLLRHTRLESPVFNSFEEAC